MLESGKEYRTFIANACLEFTIARAPPSFLRRNLRATLDAHDRRLRSASSTVRDGSRAGLAAAVDRRLASDWEFPTAEMIGDLVEADTPVLQLDVLHFRPFGSGEGVGGEYAMDLEGDEDPEWLPNPQRRRTFPARVSLHVFDVRTTKKSIFIDHRNARIVECPRSSTNGNHAYKAVLDDPFILHLYKFLHIPLDSNAGRSRGKLIAATNYSVEISVQCQNPDDASELLSRLETHGQDSEGYRQLPANETVMRATWSDFPRCPQPNMLLPLRRSKGHKVVELDYSLELSMGWNQCGQSLLERYNRICYQLPKGAGWRSSDGAEKASEMIVHYKYRHSLGTRALRIQGLSCPLCEDGVAHSSLDRLHLHFLTHHDHFDIEVDEMRSSGARAATIYLSPGEPRLTKFDDDWQWTAPDEPFSLRRELREEPKYLIANRAMKRRGGLKKREDKTLVSSVPAPPVRERPKPENVQDLPERTVRKHVVPNVPGVQFYHSTSKQQLSGGDLVADDEEMAEPLWLLQSRDAVLERRGLRGSAKQFHSSFDAHFKREQSSSHTLTNEGIVRFVRAQQPRSQKPRWRREFWKKLDLLYAHRILTDDTYAFCLTAAGKDNVALDDVGSEGSVSPIDSVVEREHSSSVDPPTMTAQRWDPKTFSFVPVVAAPSSSLHTASRDPASSSLLTNGYHGTCTCGQPALGARGTLACDNDACTTGPFHMSCVGLQVRVPGWRCPSCC